ncbi:MAG TPA: YoaK family protein, partial [Aggregicoccus sp.]|nr:YoaK family protein [Aggregicoccus sp.]
MLFNREGSAQARRQNALLAMLLAGVAGAVNAMGFYALGTHTSHVSGRVAEVGEALASGQHVVAFAALKLLLAFFLGAVCSTALLEASRHRKRGRHTPALLVEMLTLVGVALWALHHPAKGEPTLALGLSYAMGLQNALVTRVSGAVVRTTHVTGMVTDLGIELVHMVTWVRDHARGVGPVGLLRVLRALLFAVEFERAWLHVL